MNPYLQPNITAKNAINSPVNTEVRPMLDASKPEHTPIRMQQLRPDLRNSNSGNHTNYQQHQLQSDMDRNRPPNQQILPQQQQNNVLQNHLQQQQINIHRNNLQQQINAPQNHPQFQQPNRENPGVFLRQYSGKLQTDPTNKANVPNQHNQGGGVPIESQRTQMAAQVRFSNPGQSIRPPFSNPNGVTFINQSPNYNNIEASKILDNRIQPNFQSFQNDNPNDFKTQVYRDSPIDHSKKSSDADKRSFDALDTQAKLNETTLSKASARSQQESTPNAVRPDTGKKPDLINAPTFSPLESKSEQNYLIPEKNENKSVSESNEERMASLQNKIKEKTRKEGKRNNVKDGSITSGMVRKNIKFFEDNDTARKPLTPTTATVRKREKVTEVPSDVIKSEFHRNDYESGVDETPVVHPNLGKTSQVPRKVAKVPRMRGNKHLKKQRSKYSPAKKPLQKIKTFGSNEELLAFFESTKSWRKIYRYGKSAAGHNAMKDKLVYKPTTNGDISPKKTPSKLPGPSKMNPPGSPTKTPLKSPGTPGAKSLPKTPESTAPLTPLIKKVPMNKIQVGAAPSPNLKTVRSKVGSLANSTHKPGGGNIKIENHKIDLSKAQPRIEAKNDQYKPSGGDKKIAQVKLQWSAKSKVGSLENSTYKPGGGDKKIESVKLDFKEKAKPKVGSKDNVKHIPGGGNIKIENQKLEFKAQSKVGSLDNVKHKPGGGDIKIFDDKTYLRQISGNCSEGRASGTQSHRDLSTPEDLENKSNSGTPAHKTTNIKIKKITLQSFKEVPKTEKTTEVIVTSQTPIKDNKSYKRSPIKQQVTLTYSKISSTKGENKETPVGVIKVSARSDAPTLRSGLGKKFKFDNNDTENMVNENKNKSPDGDRVPIKADKNKEVEKVSFQSPDLLDDKSNFWEGSGMSKFLQDEMAAKEKIGEMWWELNAVNNKSTSSNNWLHEQK